MKKICSQFSGTMLLLELSQLEFQQHNLADSVSSYDFHSKPSADARLYIIALDGLSDITKILNLLIWASYIFNDALWIEVFRFYLR
jgi:hypothetical protein